MPTNTASPSAPKAISFRGPLLVQGEAPLLPEVPVYVQNEVHCPAGASKDVYRSRPV